MDPDTNLDFGAPHETVAELERELAALRAENAKLRAACEAAKNLDKLGFLMASNDESEATAATVRASQIKGQLIIALATEVTP